MDKIRIATPAEIEEIFVGSDINNLSTVVAFDNARTAKPDFAVIRQVVEIDPVKYAEETTDRRKVLFQWGLENALRVQGVLRGYYFNISAGDEAKEWREVLENYGAKAVSSSPELRYFKEL